MGPIAHEDGAVGDKPVATPKKRKTLRLPKTVAAGREAGLVKIRNNKPIFRL